MKWTLPGGITAGPLQFPAPKRLPLGPLMDFGYEDEVLFPFNINVAATANPGPAILHAKADWLVCQASCIPGKAELEVTRPVSPTTSAAAFVAPDRDLFKRLSGRLPKPLPAEAKANFEPTKDGFRLFVDTGRKETEAVFFPADQDTVDNPAQQQLTSTAHGFTLDLKKDANLTANPAQLKGVIELSGGRAYDISALPGNAPKSSASEPPPTSPAPTSTASSTPASPAPIATPAPTAPPSVAPSISTPIQTAPKPFSARSTLPRHRPRLPRRTAPQPHALRLPGALPERPFAHQLRQ